MSVIRDMTRAVRANPLLGIACMPPFAFIPPLREWVRNQLDEQESDMKLRAVTGPDYEDALAAVDRFLAECERLDPPSRGFSRLTRTDAIKSVTRYYITEGTLP